MTAPGGFWDEIRKIPPVTRFLCASSLAVSLPVMAKVVSPYKVIYVQQLVTKKWEVSMLSVFETFVYERFGYRYGDYGPASS
jgi:hypothetical protein